MVSGESGIGPAPRRYKIGRLIHLIHSEVRECIIPGMALEESNEDFMFERRVQDCSGENDNTIVHCMQLSDLKVARLSRVFKVSETQFLHPYNSALYNNTLYLEEVSSDSVAATSAAEAGRGNFETFRLGRFPALRYKVRGDQLLMETTGVTPTEPAPFSSVQAATLIAPCPPEKTAWPPMPRNWVSTNKIN